MSKSPNLEKKVHPAVDQVVLAVVVEEDVEEVDSAVEDVVLPLENVAQPKAERSRLNILEITRVMLQHITVCIENLENQENTVNLESTVNQENIANQENIVNQENTVNQENIANQENTVNQESIANQENIVNQESLENQENRESLESIESMFQAIVVVEEDEDVVEGKVVEELEDTEKLPLIPSSLQIYHSPLLMTN